MALVERGKGKRKQTIRVERYDEVLRMHEIEGGDVRLPGYRRFSRPEAAQAGFEEEIRARLADGMHPADDEARAIAARVKPVAPAPVALPLRCDLGIYNEATGFVVTSRRMAGKTLEDGSAAWRKAVERGDLLPLSLVQDDPFVIRVVAGGMLTAQEEAEWVARVDWHLHVPDGKLCVTGGAVFTNEDYVEMESYSEQFVGEVAIPKGRYKASLYSYLYGVNGDGVLDHLAGGHGRSESLEDWCARTRPGEKLPEWDADEDREAVSFLLHLEPIAAAPKQGLSELPEGGWFGGAENARKPDRCPLGPEARDVQRRRSHESGGWTFVRDVFPMLAPKWGSASPGNLTGGGTVVLPVAELARAARLAWFASRQTVHELRLKLPSGTQADLGGAWPDGVVAVEEEGVVRVVFSVDLEPVKVLERVGELAPRLAALPAGTVLDLCSAPVEYTPGVQEKAGWLWLRGTLKDGRWVIARALPAVSAETLEAALALAGEVTQGTRIAVSGDAERDAILAWAKRTFEHHLDDNRPRPGKDAITFQKPGYEVQLLGIAAFARRFGDVWPAWSAAEEDDRDEEDDEDDGMFPITPVKGALLHRTPGGRAFLQTMALLVSQGVADAVRAQEKELKKAGFKELGDVMCEEFDRIAYHGYFRTDKTAVAWFRVAFPDEATCEVLSLFDGGGLLLTSANATIKNHAQKGVHVQEYFGATPAELVRHHEQRLAELQAALGAPREAPTGVKALAESLAAVLEQN